MIPGCSYPASFANGDSGWAVEVLQANLNGWRKTTNDGDLKELREDGQYGGQTEKGVRTVQRRSGLKVDGVAGPRTQKRLALDLMNPAVKETGIPRCVLRGLCALESGYAVAAVNCHSEGGVDCGWMQIRVPNGGSQARYHETFYGPLAFMEAAEKLAERRTELGQLDYAILAHNWPAAAERYGEGSIHEWVYTSRERKYRMNQPAPWIEEKGIDGVATGFEWADWYVAQVKRFC